MTPRSIILKKAFATPEPLTLRETPWGYVVRSERPDGDLATPLLRFANSAVWIAVVGMWLLPVGMVSGPGFVWKVFSSVTLLALYYLASTLFRNSSGYEVQVDVSRRELRMGMLTRRGESWIRTSARFDEVGDSLVRRCEAKSETRVLCLRMKTATETVPIAIGDEASLLALHDRLIQDLRPVEEKLSSYKLARGLVPSRARRAFPKLGPEEIVA